EVVVVELVLLLAGRRVPDPDDAEAPRSEPLPVGAEGRAEDRLFRATCANLLRSGQVPDPHGGIQGAATDGSHPPPVGTGGQPPPALVAMVQGLQLPPAPGIPDLDVPVRVARGDAAPVAGMKGHVLDSAGMAPEGQQFLALF